MPLHTTVARNPKRSQATALQSAARRDTIVRLRLRPMGHRPGICQERISQSEGLLQDASLQTPFMHAFYRGLSRLTGNIPWSLFGCFSGSWPQMQAMRRVTIVTPKLRDLGPAIIFHDICPCDRSFGAFDPS